MRAKVQITLKEGVLDPRGQAVHKALERLGFAGVREVRIGTLVEIELPDATDVESAKRQVEAMCEALIANTVIEDYRVEIVES